MYASNNLNSNNRPGRSMNIYFRPEVYDRLREVIPNREINKVINDIASEYLEKNFNERERIKQSLIRSSNLRRQSEDTNEMLENISSSSLSDFSSKNKSNNE